MQAQRPAIGAYKCKFLALPLFRQIHIAPVSLAMLAMPSVLVLLVLTGVQTRPAFGHPVGTRSAAPLSREIERTRERFCETLSELTTSECPEKYFESNAGCSDNICRLCYLCNQSIFLPSPGGPDELEDLRRKPSDQDKATYSRQSCWTCAYESALCSRSCVFRYKYFDWTCAFNYVQNNRRGHPL